MVSPGAELGGWEKLRRLVPMVNSIYMTSKQKMEGVKKK